MPRGNNNKLRELRNIREQRMEIVAPLWRKNWTYHEIRKEVIRRLGLKTYAISTVHQDVKRLIAEMQKSRIADTEAKVTAELARLDLVIKEAWEMWEKSKDDYHDKSQAQQGIPIKDKDGETIGVDTIKAMMWDAEKRGCGEPRYLDIIVRALNQRSKLLGLDKTVLDINAGVQGKIEIAYIDAGVPCATSEEEILQREGLT